MTFMAIFPVEGREKGRDSVRYGPAYAASSIWLAVS
jgi:hypothetical protein